MDRAHAPIRRHGLVMPVLCALALSACMSAPGPGRPPESTVAAPRSSDPGAEAPSSAVAPCVGPLDDGPVDRALASEGAPLDDTGITLVQVDPSAARSLTLDGIVPSTAPTCATRVVVGPEEDAQLRTLAAAWALLDGVPLVLAPDPGSAAETLTSPLATRMVALGVTEIAHVGPPPAWVGATGARITDLVPTTSDGEDRGLAATLALARELQERVGVRIDVVLTLADDVTAQVDVVVHARAGVVPLVLPDDVDAAVRVLADLQALELPHAVRWAASSLEHARDLDAVLDAVLAASVDPAADRPSRWETPAGIVPDVAELWLGDVRDPTAALQAAVAAATRGAASVAVDGAELRSGVGRTRLMRAHARTDGAQGADGAATVVLVGAREEHTAWQLATVLTGTPLPGGGFLPLEERRIVALYGSPGAPGLGLLGRQDEAATIALAREYAERYADAPDGRTVVPGLDLIATVASADAEPTGDYSRRIPIARLRPLVDLAREEGFAVLLDLQPGRTDFLTQAKEYEELLREPHVHLALDPEWRIGPRERHLVRIGSVDAAEVQEVADWLAALVREQRLPQKVLMLHQFVLGMLPDRDTITIPPELVGVVHVDGQGPLATKESTYRAMTTDAALRWQWGWKNFTRIDVPVATPGRTLDRLPVPVIVTYQ
jgi:hypothetical protein